MRRTIFFRECEHEGDVDHYAEEVIAAGAKIIRTTLNEDAETCAMEVEVGNWEAFFEAFSKTDAGLFASYGRAS